MNSFKKISLFLLILISLNYLTADQLKIDNLDRVFDKCESDGRESILAGNLNCSLLTPSPLWSDEANKRCERRFEDGCKSAMMKIFCKKGVLDLLSGENLYCNHLESNQFAKDYYWLCCMVCAKGISTSSEGKECKTTIPEENPILNFVNNQFELCCSSHINVQKQRENKEEKEDREEKENREDKEDREEKEEKEEREDKDDREEKGALTSGSSSDSLVYFSISFVLMNLFSVFLQRNRSI